MNRFFCSWQLRLMQWSHRAPIEHERVAAEEAGEADGQADDAQAQRRGKRGHRRRRHRIHSPRIQPRSSDIRVHAEEREDDLGGGAAERQCQGVGNAEVVPNRARIKARARARGHAQPAHHDEVEHCGEETAGY